MSQRFRGIWEFRVEILPPNMQLWSKHWIQGLDDVAKNQINPLVTAIAIDIEK